MIAIIDYGMGNIRSVEKAFELIGESTIVSNRASELKMAEALVLPGVGAFGDAMRNLKELNLVELLADLVLDERKPFLGICLGMQLLAERGFEHGEHKGLGLIDGRVEKLRGKDIRVPHMGWNDIEVGSAGKALFGQMAEKPSFYFVHSYCLVTDPKIEAARCDYGETFTAAVHKENIYGVQFHPEKSQKSGQMLLKNFVTSMRTLIPKKPAC
ncbi:MAG TPA: imidazole glycerol phosphate synthase subunit HisH [Oculatellaceae cyanobacterium]